MIKPQIFTRIPPCDADLISQAAEIGVSDLHEGLGAVTGRSLLMSPRMRPLDPTRKIAGQALTAYNYPGDNLMMHVALHYVQPGQVLVMTSGGGHQGALWGELAGLQAQRKGAAGLICDGAVRDTQQLKEMGFPVWSTAIHASHPEKRGPGSLNIPVVIDGVPVNPGDVIVADADGVLAIPPDLLPHAIELARQRADREVEIRAKIAAGSTLYEALSIEKAVANMGADILDTTWQDAASAKRDG
jgi:4-hydroxy-4-methyl-2-oxoglutarate aldolase